MKKPLNLLVIGRISESRGKMARLIVEESGKLGSDEVVCYRTDGADFPKDLPEDAIAVYVSSKERFLEVFTECRIRRLPLIQASSDIHIPDDNQIEVEMPVILAPNLSLPVVALMKLLPMLGQMMQSLDGATTIAESHQPSKTSAPITAQTFANWFGVPSEQVGSIRNSAIAQSFLGVPAEHVDGHAYHAIRSAALGAEISVATKIHGRQTYFKGLMAVARKLRDRLDDAVPLQPGVYQLADFMF